MHPLKYRLKSATLFVKSMFCADGHEAAFHIQNDCATDTAAVVLSGDGGWRNFAKEITDGFYSNEYNTLGIDMLRYCWSYKAPSQIVSDIITQLDQLPPFNKLVICGYSFGANYIPFFYKELENKVAAELKFILLAPSAKIDFEIKLSSVVFDIPGSVDVLDKLITMPMDNTLIITDDSKFSIHERLNTMRINNVKVSGGHHFKGHMQQVSKEIDYFVVDTYR